MTLDLRIVAVAIFVAGLTLGLYVRPSAHSAEIARLEYAVGLSRQEYVRLDRRVLGLESEVPFRDFQIAAVVKTVDHNAGLTNSILGAVRELYARIAKPSPV